MNLLFIHSIMGKDWGSLFNKLLIVGICWIIVIIALIVDLIVGVHKAKIRGELRTSYGYDRTIQKLVWRLAVLMLAFLADCLFVFLIASFNSFIPAIPYLTIGVSLYIVIFVEGRSLREKAEEKQIKQINKDAVKALEIISQLKSDQKLIKFIESQLDKSCTDSQKEA